MNASIQHRVAVIDDDRAMRRSLGDLLRSFGYEQHEFTSAEAFLSRTALQFTCIVSDLHMPGMSGLDLAIQLRRAGDRTPVVLITARPTPGLGEKAAALGLGRPLSKPFTAADLFTSIQDAIDLAK